MTVEAKLTRTVLADQVKDHLMKAILDGRYPIGGRIVETTVARELGTSQGPVREALRDLEGLGVVETFPYRGARVRFASMEELIEAFEVRAELESLAARLATPRIRDSDIVEFRNQVCAMQAAADEGDIYAEAAADAEFHGRVVKLAGNRTLQHVWRSLEPLARTYITIGAPGVDRRWVADDHLPILDALSRRDATLVVTALRQHFTNAAAMLARGLAGSEATPRDGQRALSDAPQYQRTGRRAARMVLTPAGRGHDGGDPR
jgi:DNA-binding GntR family transcriptional regulator